MTSRILLADDSITIQKVVNLTFADEGIEVIAVSNGEVAERRLSEINPDLVLADIFMPGKNGYELCEFVKQSPQFRNVPVVLLVGAFEPFNEAEARRVRADAHLTKPFESRTLVETVRKLIGKSGRAGAAASQSGPLQAPVSEAQPIAQPPFNLDLSAMTPEWSPAQPPSADGNPFGVVPNSAPSTDHSPLDLDYGSLTRGDNAPSGFQIEPPESGSDTGFSFVSSVKDTAELPQIEDVVDTAPSDDSWSQKPVVFEGETAFSDDAAPPAGSGETFGAPVDESNETAGFKVQSTFSGQSPSVMLDFEKLEAPAPSVPDSVVSFDVDFSTFSTTDAPSPSAHTDPEPDRPLEVDSSEQSGWADSSQDYAVSQDVGVDFAEQGHTAAQSLTLDDPLGDVLSAETSQTEVGAFDFVPQPESEIDDQPSSYVRNPWESEVPHADSPLGASDLSGAMPYLDASATDRAGAVVHSGLSFEAFSPVVEEPAWTEPSEVTETVETALPDTEGPEEVFTSSEMWTSEVPQFAAIDIEAVTVEEAQATGDYADSLDAGTGFAFASVGDPLAEEPLPPPSPPPVVESALADSHEEDALSLPQGVIDEIVRRVVAQIGDAVVREIAWEVIPDCVERVVEKLTHEGAAKRM
ncbi:MAG TPA: response regulator [Blastocatellia bacterium]|jgi:CheY-like chemotaxis protein|nr:response regulator [Blastocatellia bacterium]